MDTELVDILPHRFRPRNKNAVSSPLDNSGLNRVELSLAQMGNMFLLFKKEDIHGLGKTFLVDPHDNLRTCFKKQGMIPRCCGFANPQRATSQGRGWVSQPIGLGNQAPTIDLTRFAEYGDNMPLNSGRPCGLRKKPSFEEKTRVQGK